jgi:hypothetical protein
MVAIIIAQFSALSIFEPFVADFVAADVEFPDVFFNIIKELRFVDIDFFDGYYYT